MAATDLAIETKDTSEYAEVWSGLGHAQTESASLDSSN